MAPAHAVRIGCSGWNYDSWRGAVYPEGLAKRRWLERYAELFDTVEVNSTFYRLPKVAAVQRWARRVAARVPLRLQGEPLPDPHQAPRRLAREGIQPYRGPPALLRAARASAGGRQARAGPLAAPRQLPPRRRAPPRHPRGRPPRAALLRVSPPELVRAPRLRVASSARRRARRR